MPRLLLEAFIATLVMAQGVGFAQEPPRRWALLVGVSVYADPGISSLRYAAKDAQEIADALLAIPHSGYTQDSLVVVGDGAGSATVNDIKTAFEHLRPKVKTHDSLLVFVSSHGIDVEKTPYLVTSDTRLEDVEGSGVSVPELFRLMRSIPVRTRILLIDACHSGMSKELPSGAMGYALHDALESGAIGSAVLSSSKLGQESFETEEFRQGVFTHLVSKALRGAEGVDRDHDGQLSLDEVAIFVERGLLDWGRSTGRIQQPWLIRTGSGAAPVVTALVPEVDVFGAQAKSVAAMGTLTLKHRIEKANAEWVFRGSIAAEGFPPGRGVVSFVAVLENGATVSWRVPIATASPMNVLPERRMPAAPTRVVLEEKLYNPEMTSFVPARVTYE